MTSRRPVLVTEDGHWQVRPVSLDGTPLLRVAHDTIQLPDGSVKVHSDGAHRMGPVQVAGGWWLVKDARSVDEVYQWVPRAEVDAWIAELTGTERQAA